jgi:superfamily II DNA or RNA helicase
MVSGGRSKIKAEQRTGRVLRAFAGKEQGLIYDFVDSQHPVMQNQSRKRVALYKSLGYQVENYAL